MNNIKERLSTGNIPAYPSRETFSFHWRGSPEMSRIYALRVSRQFFVVSSNDPRAPVIGLSTFYELSRFRQEERLVKCFYDARFRVTALLQDTLLSTAFEIKFQIKIREGMQMAPRGNVRSEFLRNFTFGSSLLPFFFFSLQLSRTKLRKFPKFRRFPRWPDYEKENHPPFLNHEWFLISRKNLIYRSKGGEMIRDYLLLLSWLCAVQGKIGKYIKIWRCVRVRAILNLFFFEGRFFERYVRKKRKITLISPSITYHGINKLTWRTIVPK